MKGRVLIVAGSDSGGGAGIQADIKTVTALSGFAATAVSALTAQNTQGVFGVVGVDPDFIQQQMRVVLDDIGADAIKTGMLHNSEVIEAVSEVLESVPEIPTVVDPVMVAASGHSLLEDDAVETLIRRLIPLARVITPNLPEAAKLLDGEPPTAAQMTDTARALLALGPEAVLLKGGHLDGDRLTDVLATAEGDESFEDTRIDTPHTHGTGCTLASAIATGIAQDLALPQAVARARAYLRKAIAAAPGLGHGHGPVNHCVTVEPFDGP
ncbi:MAG: bifunctional hydroxymethylpyrimidine kinase/phosphomethylpyrimidine kinase [Rhodovibrionaceae bacterium]|nr:bifunctional hydroxymethylpyrimidine kinase/phosphomethylpyrimidine kinase [Rhodovibrionaceae bacterium]